MFWKNYFSSKYNIKIINLCQHQTFTAVTVWRAYITDLKDGALRTIRVKSHKYYFGIFVHTGKTGEKSKSHMRTEKNILFISGSLLVQLLLDQINIVEYIESKQGK